MAAGPVTGDALLLKAVAHPLRHRILLALGEEVSSPNRIAAKLGQPLGRVSHHVRVLVRLGAIELVDTAQRRGAVEHFYRAVVRPMFDDETWAGLPRGMRRALFAQYLSRILDDVRSAASGSGFDHPRAHVSYTLLDLDAEGFDAVADILADTVQRLVEVRDSTARRLARDGAAPVRTELAVLHFERA